MERDLTMKLVILVVILIILNIIFPSIFSFATDGLTSRKSQLSVYSDEWNGVSKFRKALEERNLVDGSFERDYDVSTIISNPLILDEVKQASDTLYICVGAEKGYDSLQADAVIGFVNRGGWVLVADDHGDANSLSEQVGVEYTGHRIWSKDFEYNLSFIKINVTLEKQDYTVLMNEPTTLELHTGMDEFFFDPVPLLRTSQESYEDSNDNGEIDSFAPLDKYGKLTVGARVDPKGLAGGFIFIGDASFLINDMWDRADNAQFTLAFIEELIGREGNIIFDESRHIQPTIISNAIYNLENIYVYVILQTDEILGLVIGLALLNLFGLIYASTKHPPRFRHRFDLTYWDSYVEQAPDRLSDVRNILLKRLKGTYNLYFPDSSYINAYEPSTKTKYDLRVKGDVQALIDDPTLVDFLLHPHRYNIADRLNAIVLKIDQEFPLQEGTL